MLIHTSAVMECVASSSFPSRHQPLCLLFFPSALATNFASRRGGWGLLLSPSGWVRRMQFSVVERVGISCCFSSSSKPQHFITIGCRVEILSPQILSFPLPAISKKVEIVRAVLNIFFHNFFVLLAVSVGRETRWQPLLHPAEWPCPFL